MRALDALVGVATVANIIIYALGGDWAAAFAWGCAGLWFGLYVLNARLVERCQETSDTWRSLYYRAAQR